jgi:hypothetical protein
MSTPPPTPPSDGVSTVIPYRNGAALAAYYLGVFSLIPCLGAPLGVAAVIFGIIGLRKAGENPEAKGKVHAWVGIIAGGLFGLLWTGAFAAGLLAPLLARFQSQP